MNLKVKEKITESLSTVLPITVVVLILSVSLVPMDVEIIALFLVGGLFLIIGMGFFQLGAEISMMPIGQGIGRQLVKQKKLPLIVVVCLMIGMLITLAEPDLKVLADQIRSIPSMTLMWAVAIGVGIFLAIAVVRIFLKVPLRKVLLFLYPILFIVSFFAPDSFIAVAFDSGGVTTGPMTVPFILALGVGFSASRSDASSEEDSFGLVAISSVGPVLMVLLLGIFYNPGDASYSISQVADIETMQDVMRQFIIALPTYIEDVLNMLLPLLAVFIILQIATRQYRKRQILTVLVGFAYTFIGMTLFLTGVNVGFATVGMILGQELGSGMFKYLLIMVGVIVGFFIVKAEPAVQVLNNQVEEVTSGAISKKTMNMCLSIGVSLAVGLAMLRILTGISIYWIIIPGYIAALIMSKFVPPIFVGIAFDSGGVASGPMASTFLLPMAIGACIGVGGNVTIDAFGLVALIALAPIITIEITGVIYNVKIKGQGYASEALIEDENEIVEWEEDI